LFTANTTDNYDKTRQHLTERKKEMMSILNKLLNKQTDPPKPTNETEKPKALAKTHDYQKHLRGWGWEIDYKVLPDGTAKAYGCGKGIRAGDYLILSNKDNPPVAVKVGDDLRYSGDQWFATLSLAPEHPVEPIIEFSRNGSAWLEDERDIVINNLFDSWTMNIVDDLSPDAYSYSQNLTRFSRSTEGLRKYNFLKADKHTPGSAELCRRIDEQIDEYFESRLIEKETTDDAE